MLVAFVAVSRPNQGRRQPCSPKRALRRTSGTAHSVRIAHPAVQVAYLGARGLRTAAAEAPWAAARMSRRQSSSSDRPEGRWAVLPIVTALATHQKLKSGAGTAALG